MRRFLASLLLALTFAATSVTAAVMHNKMQGAVQMVICSDRPDGSALTSISLDVFGNPIAQQHSCPECLAALAAALLPTPVQQPALLTRVSWLHLPEPPAMTSQRLPANSARDPPVLA